MTHRETRRRRLKEYGFFPFEAKELRRVPLKTPYLRRGMVERRRAYRDAIREYKERELRFSRAEWARIVSEIYITKGWLKNGRPNAWEMLRDWERKYRAEFPDYESPPKRRLIKIRRHDEFQAKFARSKEANDQRKYPRGATY